MMLDATVVTHGIPFVRVAIREPSFPIEAVTTLRLSIVANEASIRLSSMFPKERQINSWPKKKKRETN